VAAWRPFRWASMMICSRISAPANFSWPDDEFDPEKQFEFCRCGAFWAKKKIMTRWLRHAASFAPKNHFAYLPVILPLGLRFKYKSIQSCIPRRAGRLFFWTQRYFINASDISGPIRLFFLCVGYFEKPKKNKIAETLKQPKHHSSLSWINLKCIIV